MNNCPNCFTENIGEGSCFECGISWPDESGAYLMDGEEPVICSSCGNAKMKLKCDQVEFSCGGEDHACEGWAGSCCECGYDYGRGQM